MHALIRSLAGIFVLVFCGLSISHAQQNAQALYQRTNAAMCANCHGSEGKATEGSSVPSLMGMPKDYMVLQMKAFKDGSRTATVMHQLSKGLSDAQIDSIATYFANNKR